ncbi:TPA: sugar transferase, partial [Streptococcus suis]
MININGYRQLRLAFLELVGVAVAIFLTYQFPNSDLNRISILLVLALHFIAFYVSRMASDFESRGHFVEIEKIMVYTLFFGLLLTFFSFML